MGEAQGYDEDLLEWLEGMLRRLETVEQRASLYPWDLDQGFGKRITSRQYGDPVTVVFHEEDGPLTVWARNAMPGVVAAGRQLLELARQLGYVPALDRAIRCLAEGFETRPGYRAEWRPGDWRQLQLEGATVASWTGG